MDKFYLYLQVIGVNPDSDRHKVSNVDAIFGGLLKGRKGLKEEFREHFSRLRENLGEVDFPYTVSLIELDEILFFENKNIVESLSYVPETSNVPDHQNNLDNAAVDVYEIFGKRVVAVDGDEDSCDFCCLKSVCKKLANHLDTADLIPCRAADGSCQRYFRKTNL